MRISPSEFHDMTPAEFIHVWFMWNNMQQDIIKQQWERTRWATWILTTIQLDKNSRLPMNEMFPFPWEKTIEYRHEMSIDERKSRVKELLKDCT